MNKTIAMIAVILTVFTAFFVMNIDTEESDGAAYVTGPGMKKYYTIDDADTTVYTDEMLSAITTTGRFYIASETIRDDAFRGCTKISYVLLRVTTSIGNSAFEGCTKLYGVMSQDKLASIGNNAFKDADHLMEASFTSDLTAIGTGAFQGCTSLLGPVLFGTSVTSIGNSTFAGTSIAVEDLRNVTYISGTAYSGTDLKAQILREGQTAKVAGVQAVYVRDFDIQKLVTISDNSGYTLKIRVDDSISLMSRMSGDVSAFNSEGETWVGTDHFCNIFLDGTDLHLELLKYRIHFEDYLGMNDVVHISGDGTYTMPVPTVGAPIFKGWRIGGFSGYITQLTESDFQTAGILIEPTAEFEQLTVTFDHSAVSSSPGYAGLTPSMTFSVNGTYPSLPDITGYTFSGWKVSDLFYSAGSKITNLSNHTAKSVWNAEMLTLTLVHADCSSTVQQIQAGSAVNLSALSTSEPDSKRFIGWSTAENGSVLTSNPLMDSDKTLYAVFTDRAAYIVRFLDGSTVLHTQSGYEGRTLVLDMEEPSVPGKVFVKWMMGDREVEKGEPITLESDVDIVSVWNQISLNITYHVNSNEIRTYGYGENATIGCDAGTMMGHVLSGWSTTENGSVIYTEGDVIAVTGNIDLYPCWVSNGKYVVTLHDYMGRSSQTETEPNASYTIPNPTQREGKTFSGWSVTSGGDVAYQSGNTFTVTDNTDLYEVWTDIMHCTVTMHRSDSSMDTSIVVSGTDFTIPAVASREAYDFKGWAVSPNGNAVYRDGESIRITADADLYEVWTEKAKFTVTVHSEPAVTETAYAGQSVTVSLPSMSRTGYDLAGWSTSSASSSAQYDPQSDATATSTTDFYPVWIAKSICTVKVHMTGSETSDYTVYEGESVTLPASMGRSDGRTHEGWTANSDGTGKFFSAGSTFYPSGSLELYAYWSEPEMAKLYLKDGNTNLSVVNIQKGESFDLSEYAAEKEGYILKGWSKNRTSTSVAYGTDAKITVSYDTIVYAVWEKLISVKFIDGDSVRIVYAQKDSQVELPVLSKDGYEFRGWTLKGSETILESLTATQDTELSSSWKSAEPPVIQEPPVTETEPAAEEPEDETPEIPAEDGPAKTEPVADTPSSGGGSGITVGAVAAGAAIAIISTVLIVFQIRRA